ncbi:hypothetical protein [Brevibacillus agri]|uniref:hypothetical protein n=1 Tax=Brevibacillus agri TaxID=51101 RepID=UPI0004723990|nr:hypothetical protein [Brevibacillus agri]
MINLFQPNPDDFRYILESFGQWITVNNQPVQAVITNTPINQTSAAIDFDDKKLATLTPIKCGDIVHYNDEDWLIISEINGQRYGKYKGIIRVCDYPIKFNIEGTVKEFPTIIDGKVFDTETGQFMTLPNSKILVTLQENQETLQIEVGQRFIKMGSAWQVDAIDRTHKGLLRLWCKQDQFNKAVDDVENEIADAGRYESPDDDTGQGNNTLTINGDSDIIINRTKTWTTTLIQYGQQVPIQSATWSVTSATGGMTDLVTFTNQTSESCSLKAGTKLGYFKLICGLADGSLRAEKEIRVKSLI